MRRLNAKTLRHTPPPELALTAQKLPRHDMYLVLENVYDTYNIGGLFRLADALAIRRMYLCGETTPPPNNRIHKASCGTYKIVPWEYCVSASIAIRSLQAEHTHTRNTQIVAIEQSPSAIPYTSLTPHLPLALVVGNETTGITPETLALCDTTVEIPMWGINKSLNVIVSAAIVSYHLMRP